MNYRSLKILTIIIPPLLIGGFEFIRHDFLLDYLSMEAGNLYITVLTLIISFILASWMFSIIRKTNQRLVHEQSKRAVYEERERLARELHDNIAQTLFFLNVKLKQGNAEEARSAAAEIDDHLRQAIFNLRSTPQDGVTFRERLQKWTNEWQEVTGIGVIEKWHFIDGFFSPTEEIQLFSIVQETFTNIRKHSMATIVNLQLRTYHSDWEMIISDNGKGMKYTDNPTNQYGISMMKKRASEIGATIELRNGEQVGVEVIVKASRGVNK